MRGISLVSGILFLVITITAVMLVYEAGVPVIQKMQSAAAIEKMHGVLSELDKIIREIASEGKGSKRTVYFRVDPGRLVVNETYDFISWELDTAALVVSPRTSKQFGNIIIGSNMETYANETNFTATGSSIPAWIMENKHLRVWIKKIGSPSNYTNYNTTELLLGVYSKDEDKWLDLEYLEISLDNNESSMTGNGFTSLSKIGYNQPYATVSAYMNSNYIDYYINFTLESGADFIKIEAGV